MKKPNKKGFTLIEILAAVTILGILSILAIFAVNNIIQRGKEEHYKTAEKNLRLTAQTYAQTNRSYLPKNIGDTENVTVRTMVEDNYIEDVKDYYDKSCDPDESYVQIFKYSKTGYSYLTYLDCPDYSNREEIQHMKPVIEIEMTSDKDNVAKTEAKVKIKDEDKLLSYQITVYKHDEEVYTTGSLNALYVKELNEIVNLSRYTPGKIKVEVEATNIYGQKTTKSKTVTYTDKRKPECIIAEADRSRTDDEWITTERKITVGCNDGPTGSGCTRETYTKTFKSDAKMGTITIEDKAGNKANCEVAVYIDKTPPTCTVTPSGTEGINDWWKTNNVTMTLETNKGAATQSPIKAYDLTTSTTPTYVGTTKTKTQTNTAGTIWYGYVKDAAGNVNKCQSGTIKVDTNSPTCSIASSGTQGTNNWYTSNATITLTTNDTGPSTVGTYDLTTSTSASYSGTTKTKTQTDTAGTKWYGYVKDKAGNIGSCSLAAVKVDTKAPTCSISKTGTTGDNSWYKSSVSLSLTTNDTGTSTVDSYNLTTSTTPSYSGTTTGTQTNTAGITWYGYVKDKAGNTNTCNSGTVKVDTESPTCSIASSGTTGDNGWYKSDATMTLTTNDTGPSSLKSYDLTTSSSASYSGTTKTKTQTNTTGTTWYGYVKDNAGNVGNCSSSSVKVDTTAPTCSISKTGTTGDNSWYKSNVSLSLSTDDKGGSTVDSYNLTTSSSASYSGTTTGSQANTTGTTWYGYVKDKAGNTGNCNTGTIKVDTAAPTCSVSLSGSHNGSFYVTNVTVSLTKNDTGGSNLASYGLANSSTVNYNSKTSGTQVTNVNGTTWYGFVKDGAGNTGTCNSGHFVVKASPPTITFSLSGSTSTAICKDGTTGKEIKRWTKSIGNSTHTVTCTDSYGLSRTCSQSYKSSTSCYADYSCACTGCCGTCKSGWCYCCCNYCGESCSTTYAKSGGTSCN